MRLLLPLWLLLLPPHSHASFAQHQSLPSAHAFRLAHITGLSTGHRFRPPRVTCRFALGFDRDCGSDCACRCIHAGCDEGCVQHAGPSSPFSMEQVLPSMHSTQPWAGVGVRNAQPQ